GFDAHLSGTRYGTYWARNAVVAYDQRFGPQEVVNLSAGYRLFANARVSAGINNLLDSHPDQVLPAARNPVVALYSGLSPEGGAGRTYFARLDLSF
ncbi:TonB-dependent receptor, partial [Escherichia coli]|nr:TonB-dependent receptor [Escherichia coli]